MQQKSKAPKKKWKRWLGRIFLVLVVAFPITWWMLNESPPEGKQGPEADALALKIQQAVDVDAWNELGYVSWSHRDDHHYSWSRKKGLLDVAWGDYNVQFETETDSATAYSFKQKVGDPKLHGTLVHLAQGFWKNDSWWANPFVNLMDTLVERSIVMDGNKPLLHIAYKHADLAPGTHYLWYTHDDGMPYKVQVWSKKIPLQGMAFTWEDWITLQGGAKVARSHKGAWLEIVLKNFMVFE